MGGDEIKSHRGRELRPRKTSTTCFPSLYSSSDLLLHVSSILHIIRLWFPTREHTVKPQEPHRPYVLMQKPSLHLHKPKSPQENQMMKTDTRSGNWNKIKPYSFSVHSLNQWLSTDGTSALHGNYEVWRHFWISEKGKQATKGAIHFQGLETRSAAKHSTITEQTCHKEFSRPKYQ